MLFKIILLALLHQLVYSNTPQYHVHSFPGAPEPLPNMHAGNIQVDPAHNGSLFFWHIQSRYSLASNRTVIWFNGGPGCSSVSGALLEIGPYRVTSEGKLEHNTGSWDELANLLFVDQPVGTGFGHVNPDGLLQDLDEMAGQFVAFLDKWLDIFPEYGKNQIYLAGESYAGQYIPYIARAIQQHNEKPERKQWNLRGLLIGNGWISPAQQYPAYLSYAYQTGLLQRNSPSATAIETTMSICQTILNNPEETNQLYIRECELVLQQILEATVDERGSCYNKYDVRFRDAYPSCGMTNRQSDLENTKSYLQRGDVMESLNVHQPSGFTWERCSREVGRAFTANHSAPSVELLPELLENGLSILIYTGDQDMLCNYIGTAQLVQSLVWNGAIGMRTTQQDFIVQNQSAGVYQSARNLTHLVVYNASHMVPYDLALQSQYMLDWFISGAYIHDKVTKSSMEESMEDAKLRVYRKAFFVLVLLIGIVLLRGIFLWYNSRWGYRKVDQEDGNGSQGHHV